MEYRIGYRRSGADYADLADSLAAEGAGVVIRLSD
jgi:hypothetical protein